MEEKSYRQQEKQIEVIKKIVPRPAGKSKGTEGIQKANDSKEE
jgi:hypothetical protein